MIQRGTLYPCQASSALAEGIFRPRSRARTFAHGRLPSGAGVYVYIYIYMHIEREICMYVCMYVYIYIYIYAHVYVFSDLNCVYQYA